MYLNIHAIQVIIKVIYKISHSKTITRYTKVRSISLIVEMNSDFVAGTNRQYDTSLIIGDIFVVPQPKTHLFICTLRYCSSSSSSKLIFQQRTFKNHKIQKYKLHVTCNT